MMEEEEENCASLNTTNTTTDQPPTFPKIIFHRIGQFIVSLIH